MIDNARNLKIAHTQLLLIRVLYSNIQRKSQIVKFPSILVRNSKSF